MQKSFLLIAAAVLVCIALHTTCVSADLEVDAQHSDDALVREKKQVLDWLTQKIRLYLFGFIVFLKFEGKSPRSQAAGGKSAAESSWNRRGRRA
jgi:hypothetical protein